jgi:Putative zinc-finger
VTHLGQRLSALVDGELASSERERVFVHMATCGSCRDEVAALRMLKLRLNGVGEIAAGAGLTGRLMGLIGLDDSRLAADMPSGQTVWPPPGGWPVHRAAQGGAFGGGEVDSTTEFPQPESGHGSREDLRAGRLFLAGSVVVFLAGLGTAALIAGGEPQTQAPAPPVTPSIDVLVVPHDTLTGTTPTAAPGQPIFQPDSEWLRPVTETSFVPRRP